MNQPRWHANDVYFISAISINVRKHRTTRKTQSAVILRTFDSSSFCSVAFRILPDISFFCFVASEFIEKVKDMVIIVNENVSLKSIWDGTINLLLQKTPTVYEAANAEYEYFAYVIDFLIKNQVLRNDSNVKLCAIIQNSSTKEKYEFGSGMGSSYAEVLQKTSNILTGYLLKISNMKTIDALQTQMNDVGRALEFATKATECQPEGLIQESWAEVSRELSDYMFQLEDQIEQKEDESFKPQMGVTIIHSIVIF